MKNISKYFLSCLLVITSFLANAQITDSLELKVSRYPNRFNNTTQLADRIEKDFTSDMQKAKAAFVWIALNISYNTSAVGRSQKIHFSYRSEEELQAKKKAFRDELAQKTLIRRKALCEGYATLYQDLCRKMNLECEIVPGIARRNISEIGQRNLPSNHAWNAVKINDNWFLVDATWAAGWVDYSTIQFHKKYTAAYFSANPNEFALKHFPDDKQWLLNSKIKSYMEFVNQVLPFTEFLGKNISLLSPKKGMQELKKGEAIQFQFANFPEGIELAYHFKSDRYGQKLKPYRKSDSLIFKIYPEFIGTDELIIYFNNQPALGYRIRVK